MQCVRHCSSTVNMGKSTTGKKETTPHDPRSDPKVLLENYAKACKLIGIEPSKSLSTSLADEENTTRGWLLMI